jgi:hypothetical protein
MAGFERMEMIDVIIDDLKFFVFLVAVIVATGIFCAPLFMFAFDGSAYWLTLYAGIPLIAWPVSIWYRLK